MSLSTGSSEGSGSGSADTINKEVGSSTKRHDSYSVVILMCFMCQRTGSSGYVPMKISELAKW